MATKDYAWVFDPHSGGTTLPAAMREPIRNRLISEFDRQGLARGKEIKVRFRGQFCYVAVQEPDCSSPTELFRLRYFSSRDRWSVAFFAYSSEQYQICIFPSGKELGSPEEAVELARVYL